MGIQDRDYYRNEGPSVFDSLMPSGLICRWLIGINVVVFILQLFAQSAVMAQGGSGWVTDWFILDVDAVRHGQVWRLLTYAFLHSPALPFFHLLFNMLFLWWFGSDVEQLYGRKEFLAIYLLSAIFGGVAFEAWGLANASPPVMMPNGEFVQMPMRCLGASGAVTTMLVLCARHFPRRIVYFFGIVPMPIWLFALFNIAQDAFLFVGPYKTNVAVVVHLAGAGFALLYYHWQHSIVEVVRSLFWWQGAKPRARLKLFRPETDKEEPVAVTSTSTAVMPAAMDEHLEAKLDAVLEKIAKTGKESLTQQEQDILRLAAAMYKRRRT